MDTRRIAKEYRLHQWSQIMQERSGSGLSIKEFCKQRGIHQNTYYYWQRKLRNAASEKMMGIEAQETSDSSEVGLVPKGWAVCEQGPPKGSPSIIPIKIGKCQVLTDEHTSPEALDKVCRVLVDLC